MAFRPTVLFAVANQGTTPRILAVQAPQSIDANAAGVTGFTLVGTTSLVDGAGNTLAGAYETAFTITYTAGDNGTLAFNRAGYDGLPAILRDRLLTAFATGGRLVLTVDVAGPNTTEDLPVNLAALRTSDFVVNAAGTTATPAHHPHAVAPTANLVPAAQATGAGSATYTFTCAAIGAGSLTVDAAGVFTVSATTPPASTSDINLSIQTSLTDDDGAGNPFALVATSVIPIDLHLHTEILLTIDRSGSMSSLAPTGNSKWDEAVTAVNLFSTLYGDAIPVRSTPNGTVLDNYRLKFGRWRFQAAFNAEYDPDSSFEAAAMQLQHSPTLTPGGMTPGGQALTDAFSKFTAGNWRRRHLMYLTDGMSNTGTPTLQTVHTNPATHLPSTDDDANDGVRVHTVSYALNGETPVITLEDMAADHGGISLATATDPLALDPESLREMFLNVLAQVVPIELETNMPGDTTFDIEDGVERVIFVARGAAALTAAGPLIDTNSDGVPDTPDSQNATGTVGNLAWASVDDPAPGVWTISGAPAANQIYAIRDVALRMSTQVVKAGLGQPIKLSARLHFLGEPVTGADVRVAVRRPGESIGEVITSFVRRKGLARAVQRPNNTQLLHPDLGVMLAARPTRDVSSARLVSAATAAVGVPSGNGDTKSLQRLLLEAAEQARNLEFQNVGTSIQLVEVSPGVYEGQVPASLTQEEGVYDCRFKANGFTPAGYAFGRDQRKATVLAPTPSGTTSESSITQTVLGATVLYTITVFPRSVTGRPLGPGLGYTLGFHYATEADRKKLPEPVTLDNIDGTYSTLIELPRDTKLPDLVLTLGTPKGDLSNGMKVEDRKRVKKVRVRLEKIQVLDDKDGIFTGRGELAFSTVVAPNANPNRAVRTRYPEKGTVKASSGQVLDVGSIIYEGLVEADSNLSITIGGTEFDYLLFFSRKEKLARYHRTLPLKSLKMQPGDEPNDPESLRDWEVWYTVEVE